MVTSILINGLVLGGMYAILVTGFSLVFGVARILNMAHTAFYMCTAFLVFSFTTMLRIHIIPASIMAIIAVSLLGIICYKLCFDRIKVHGSTVMIVSVAIGMLLQEVFLLIFGEQYQTVAYFI